MSQKNVEIVRRFWAAWDRGDVTELLEHLSDDTVTVAEGIDGVVYHGKAGYLDLLEDWGNQFSGWSATAEEFVEAGDKVVVRNRQVAHGEASAVPVEGVYWCVYTLSEGKIVRQVHYAEGQEALEAAALSE